MWRLPSKNLLRSETFIGMAQPPGRADEGHSRVWMGDEAAAEDAARLLQTRLRGGACLAP